MKILTFLICIFLPSLLFPQQNDDIRLFPSLNHQTENSIAIDPTNNDNILVSTIGRPEAGKVHITYFYSLDRGITWNGSETTPNGALTKGDPIAFFDYCGNAYISYKGGNSGIYCIKSTNKGQSWGPAVTVTGMDEADKEYLTADLSGTYPNNIYAAWTDFNSQYFDVRYTRSTNSGATFVASQIVYSNPTHYGQGTFITTAINGYVYLVFARLGKGSNTENAIMFTKSTNGGQSYSTPLVAFTIAGIGPPDDPQERFGYTRANSFPSMDVCGGIIYIVYADESNGNSDVYLRYSLTGGDTWSAPIMVNSESSNQQWFPSVSADESNNKVYVSYFSMDGSDYATSHYIAVTNNYPINFTRTKVSNVSFVPEDLGVGYAEGYMGDYYEIKASYGWVFPCWSHNNNLSGKFQAYISPIGGESIELDQKLSNNITTVDKIDLYSGSVFKELEIPKVYHLKSQTPYVLRGEQGIYSNEKYNKWNIDDDVLNHRTFSFETGQAPQSLISRFIPTYSYVNIQNNFYEYLSLNPSGDEIKFKDPWYIDYRDGLYSNNLRNRGMDNAEWRSRLSNPFNPDYNTVFTNGSDPSQSYKGVFLDQDPTFDPEIPNYVVKAVVPLSVTLYNTGNQQSGRTHKFYFKNWSGTDVDYEDKNDDETGVVFLDQDAVLNANLKGTQLSSELTAYDYNSQHKFVRTDNGHLHNVYISMSALWYERSTDGGTTWDIVGGQPINSNNPKQVSIDYLPPGSGTDVVLIAYQCTTSTGSKVVVDVYIDGAPRAGGFRYDVVSFTHSPGLYNNINAEPVISLAQEWDFLIVYKVPSGLPLGDDPETTGLYFSYGWLNGLYGWQLTWWSPSQKWVVIPTTGANSIHPTIGDDIYSGDNFFHIAYQENNQIKYYYLHGQTGTGSLSSGGDPYVCSNNTGFSQHYNPSIISMGTTARVCWVGYRTVYYEEENEVDAFPQYRVLFRRPGQTTFWQFGNNVSLPNINKRNDNTYYALAWSENNSQVWFADNTLSTVRLLDDVTGQQIQVSNGTATTNMYCMTYEHNTGVPHYFERSNNLDSYYQSHKITNNFFSSGREGVVSVDSSEFYFAVGDIEVDGQTISFIEIPDTAEVNNLNAINQCLITEPIALSDNSSFIYSVQYGLNDSLSAVQGITGDRFINFKVLLIDDATGQTIGEYDNVTYTQNNLYQYNNISYQVNTQGIGNRTVRLKLVLDNNFSSEYSLSRIFADGSVLGKTTIKQISYSGSEVIKSYELSQNYPNPFNPMTTIKFQIPKAGNVTLKVYDILGSEVVTLVDEFKEVGKFEVNFDASRLASGVYIYRLNVNDYVNVKKMMLLK